MPVFPSDLREVADEALARIAGDENGPAANWVDAEDWKEWRAVLMRLRAVLVPPRPSIALFEVQPEARQLQCSSNPPPPRSTL